MLRLWNRPDLRHHRVSLKAHAMQVLAVLDEDKGLNKLSLGTASAASKQAAERIEPALHHLEQKGLYYPRAFKCRRHGAALRLSAIAVSRLVCNGHRIHPATVPHRTAHRPCL